MLSYVGGVDPQLSKTWQVHENLQSQTAGRHFVELLQFKTGQFEVPSTEINFGTYKKEKLKEFYKDFM